MLCPGADQRVALSMLGVLVLLALGGRLTVSGSSSSAFAAGLNKLHNVEEVIMPILGKATSADWINSFSFGIAAGVVFFASSVLLRGSQPHIMSSMLAPTNSLADGSSAVAGRLIAMPYDVGAAAQAMPRTSSGGAGLKATQDSGDKAMLQTQHVQCSQPDVLHCNLAQSANASSEAVVPISTGGVV